MAAWGGGSPARKSCSPPALRDAAVADASKSHWRLVVRATLLDSVVDKHGTFDEPAHISVRCLLITGFAAEYLLVDVVAPITQSFLEVVVRITLHLRDCIEVNPVGVLHCPLLAFIQA